MKILINHGHVSSTDVAGGILGTLSQSTSGESSNTFQTLINYGDVNAINKTNISSLYEQEDIYANLIFYDNDDEFVQPILNNINTKRGIGGIFGRLQSTTSQTLGNINATNARFKIILNLNDDVDFIGHIDNPYIDNQNLGYLRTPVLDTTYSAKINDNTPMYRNKVLNNDMTEDLKDYNFRFGTTGARTAVNIRFAPYEALADRFKTDDRYENGMFVNTGRFDFNDGTGRAYILFSGAEEPFFGSDFDLSPNIEDNITELEKRFNDQNQVKYNVLANTVYSPSTIRLTFTDSGPLYMGQPVLENYDDSNKLNIPLKEFELELNLNFLEKSVTEISYYITGHFEYGTLIARTFEDSGFNNKEDYRQALIQEYEARLGGYILTGDYAPLLTLDLTNYDTLEEDLEGEILGKFVVYSEASIFNSQFFEDDEYLTEYTVKIDIIHRQFIDSPKFTEYKIGNNPTQPVTPIEDETHMDYEIKETFDNDSSIVMYFVDDSQVVAVDSTLDLDNVVLEYYDPITDTFVEVLYDKTISNLDRRYYKKSTTKVVLNPVTEVRTFNISFSFNNLLRNGRYRLVYNFHPFDEIRYVYFDFQNAVYSSVNTITEMTFANDINTERVVNQQTKEIFGGIVFNKIVNINYVEDTLTGEIELGETANDPLYVYLQGPIYSYDTTQSGFLNHFNRGDDYSQILSVINTNYPDDFKTDPINKTRTYNFEILVKAQNGDLATYTFEVQERSANISDLYHDEAKIEDFDSVELTIERESLYSEMEIQFDVTRIGSNSVTDYFFYKTEPDSTGYNYFDVVLVNDDNNTDGFNWRVTNLGNDHSLYLEFEQELIRGQHYVHINYHRFNGEVLTIAVLNIYKLLGLDAYLTNIKFTDNIDDTSTPDMYEADLNGNIVENSDYDIYAGFEYIFYDGSMNLVHNYRVDGQVSNIPLDHYSPLMVDYLPEGATISRLYYDSSGSIKWTDPVGKDDPIEDREILYANFTVVQSTGQEANDEEEIIVTYKVMSEERNIDRKVDVYYHVTVVDIFSNVNFIFELYHRTGTEGSYTDTLIKNSSLKDEVIRINISNFDTDVEVTNVSYPLVKDFPVFSEITLCNYSINQFYIATYERYQNRFSRNVSGFFSFDVYVKHSDPTKAYSYTIIHNDQTLNDLSDFDVSGKYFYIHGSIRQRTRRFQIYIFEVDKTDDSWGLTDKYDSLDN